MRRNVRLMRRVWKADVSEDVDAEIEFHIEARADAYERSGMTREAARARAVAEFGDMAGAKIECIEIDERKYRRDRRGATMGGLVEDVRYALRMLRRSPAFTGAALLVVGLGIGGNAALFAAMSSLFLHPAPGVVADAQRVWVGPVRNGRPGLVSYADYEDYASRKGLFEGVAAWSDAEMSVSRGGPAEHVSGQFVSPDYFRVLGVRAIAGRDFSGDASSGGAPVAMIGEAMWRDRFEASLEGGSITINGQPFSVVGVVPADFTGAETGDDASIWLPLYTLPLLYPARREWMVQRDAGWLNLLGRLRDAVSPAAAASALTALTTASHVGLPDADGELRVSVTRARSGLRPGQAKEGVPILAIGAAITLLVLFIAFSNFATLLIGRGTVRRTEFAVRLSLGAAASRITRMLMTEVLLLAIGGGTLGILFASWILSFVTTLMPADSDRIVLRPDVLTAAVALVLALVTGFGFGLAPVLGAARSDPLRDLRERASSGGMGASRMRRGLVMVQVSLSFVLLALTGLFLRSIRASQQADVGFDAKPTVLAATFDLSLQGYSPARADAFRDELLRRAGTLPGVQVATMADNLPLSNRLYGTAVTTDVATQTDLPRTTYVTRIRPGYFRAIGNPLLAGRDFSEHDTRGAPLTVIVNEAFVHAYFPDGSALGAHLNMGGDGPPDRQIIGIAKDAMYHEIGEAPRPYAFLPLAQVDPEGIGQTILVLRTGAGSAARLAGPVRDLFASLDPALPVFRLVTLDEQLREKIADRRFGVSLVSAFGALALLLSVVGLYGITAFNVSRRTREVGVRLAVGAQQADILQLFIRENLRIAGTGILIGLVLAALISQFIRGLLFGVTATDTLTFVLVALLLAVTAALASWLPVKRALSIDPVAALHID